MSEINEFVLSDSPSQAYDSAAEELSPQGILPAKRGEPTPVESSMKWKVYV